VLCQGSTFCMRHKENAARAATLAQPSVNHERPHARKQSLWIFRIHHQIGAAGVFIGEEYANPILATISCAKHAALLLRTVRMTDSARHHNVGILWIYHNVANAPRVVESHQLPRLAGISRFVDSLTN